MNFMKTSLICCLLSLLVFTLSAESNSSETRISLMIKARKAEKIADWPSTKSALVALLKIKRDDPLVLEKLASVNQKMGLPKDDGIPEIESPQSDPVEKKDPIAPPKAQEDSPPKIPPIPQKDLSSIQPIEKRFSSEKASQNRDNQSLESLLQTLPEKPVQNTNSRDLFRETPPEIFQQLEKILQEAPTKEEKQNPSKEPQKSSLPTEYHAVIQDLNRIHQNLKDLESQYKATIVQTTDRNSQKELLAEFLNHKEEVLKNLQKRNQYLEKRDQLWQSKWEEQQQLTQEVKDQLEASKSLNKVLQDKLELVHQDAHLQDDYPSPVLMDAIYFSLQGKDFSQLTKEEKNSSPQSLFQLYQKEETPEPLSKKQIQRLFYAALNGNSEAQLTVAQRRMDGELLVFDKTPTLHWLLAAAKGGNLQAVTLIGDLYRQGKRLVKQDLQEAYAWYEVSLKYGDKAALYRLRQLESEMIRAGQGNQVHEARFLATEIQNRIEG